MPPTISDYRQLFLQSAPLIDVRAPIEFAKGAFPAAVNLPLMNDSERHEVGICYKKHGQSAAIALGHKLVQGKTKTARLEAWETFARDNPNGFLYCFRGGLRSRISQQWLHEASGICYPYIEGGYKAMRHFLTRQIEHTAATANFTVLAGLAGSGKTDVLAKLPHAINLEGLAHHRGSSFGKRAGGQPSQIDFEHRLSIALLHKTANEHRHFVLEDESRIIGHCAIPACVHTRMQQSQLVWLEEPLNLRVQRILRDYINGSLAEFEMVYGQTDAFSRFATQLQDNLKRITRRLGDQAYRKLASLMNQALETQKNSGLIDAHEAWVYPLLHDYYDPMYRYQLQRKASRPVFSGNQQAVVDYLAQLVNKA